MTNLPPIGDVIEVYWTEEQRWYPGKVVATDIFEKCFSVMYEDEDTLFVHSVDANYMPVEWRPVTDKLVEADVNLRFTKVIRSRSKLAKEIAQAVKQTQRRTYTASNNNENDGDDDNDANDDEDDDDDVEDDSSQDTTDSADNVQANSDSNESASDAEPATTASITNTDVFEKPKTRIVTPPSSPVQKVRQQHLSPLVAKIKERREKYSTLLAEQDDSQIRFSEHEPSEQENTPVRFPDQHTATAQSPGRRSFAQEPTPVLFRNRLRVPQEQTHGSVDSEAEPSDDDDDDRLSPDTIRLRNALIKGSPAKKKRKPTPAVHSSSPYKKRILEMPTTLPKQTFSSPLKPPRPVASFVAKQRQIEAAAKAAIVHASPTKKSNRPLDTSDQPVAPRPRSRSSSFDRSVAQNATTSSAPLSHLPLELDPSGIQGQDGFVSIPASSNSFKTSQALTESQIEKRRDHTQARLALPMLNPDFLGPHEDSAKRRATALPTKMPTTTPRTTEFRNQLLML